MITMEARDPSDSVYQQWLKYGTFQEIEELGKVKSMCLGGTYVDIGANVGNHSVFFGTFCLPDLVVAVEPVHEFSQCLIRNMAINCPQQRYRLVRSALGAIEGLGYMAKSEHHPAENTWAVYSEGGDTEIVTLDSLNLYNVSLIKIDVEGQEPEVLKGATKTLTRCAPVLLLEAVVPHKLDDIAAVIGPLGYKTDGINLVPEGAPMYMWRMS
jgi:FkbM family methyltransferase